MADLDAILARLEQLETENAVLRERLDALDGPSPGGGQAPEGQVSRRSLLRRAGTGAAALGVGVLGASLATLSQPTPARANGEFVNVGGTYTEATGTTTIRNHANDTDVFFAASSAGGAGIHGYSASADGVYGDTLSGYGVHGRCDGDSVGGGVLGEHPSNLGVLGRSTSGTGVQGTSDSGDGVVGGTTSGVGVRGFSTTGNGVAGRSSSSDGLYGTSRLRDGVRGETDAPDGVGARGYAWDGNASGKFGTGVLGSSGSHAFPPPRARANTGVMGIGARGRGGVFIGDLAQVQLVPSSASTHPTTGTRGDLFADKSGRLWFCKGGTTWRQLA